MTDPSRTTAARLRAGAGAVARRGLHLVDALRLREDGGPAVVVGLLLVLAGAVGFGVVLDAVQEMDDIAALDRPVLDALVAVRSGPVTAALLAVTTVTGPVVLPVVVVVAALAWGLLARRWWQAGLLAFAMVLSTLVSSAIKAVVARPRPPVDTQHVAGAESTYSFPSGHTIGTATLLLVGGYLLWVARPGLRSLVGWLTGIVVGTALVALSRLYLGYHFLSDVAASVALAVAVLGVVVVLDRRRAQRAARAPADAGGGRRPRQDSNLRPTD